ncbi:MAG: hypothetical protein JWN57_2499 [Frankiales bacterium]|nr:hypothetical protein [Frankiales bacterium]
MRFLPRRAVLALAVAGLAATAVVPAAGASVRDPKVSCTDSAARTHVVRYPVAGQTAQALVALPKRTPRGIVVFDHGYGHTMHSWARHASRTAATLGVIAIAPDYRGQKNLAPHTKGGLPSSRGWRVAEGAADSIAAAQLFERACRPAGPNVIYGVSMGGNTSGLALAARPKQPGGTPLFDWWVNVEGAANVTETYAGARVLARVNEFAANAVQDIEQAFGGPLEATPETYAQRTVVHRVDDIAASGVKGVVMVHGVADGLVTHDVSRQLQVALRSRGVPVSMLAVVTRAPGSEPGTTADGYLPTGIESPFAGHASEASETHVVGKAGFAALARLYDGAPFRCDEGVYDGLTGVHRAVTTGC